MKNIIAYIRHGAIDASIITLCLLLLLTACTSGAPTTVPLIKSTAPPTATSAPQRTIPAGTLLYQADWSHGFAAWKGSGWKVAQGQLVTTNDGTLTIVSPYQPPVHSYAVEVRIQIAKLFHNVGGYFTIFASKVAGHDGFQAGVNTFMEPGPRPNGSHPQAQIITDPPASMEQGDGRPIDYEPLANWHTYRIEVQDTLAGFYIDGTLISTTTTSATPTLSTGPLGITCSEAILIVKDFRITAM